MSRYEQEPDGTLRIVEADEDHACVAGPRSHAASQAGKVGTPDEGELRLPTSVLFGCWTLLLLAMVGAGGWSIASVLLANRDFQVVVSWWEVLGAMAYPGLIVVLTALAVASALACLGCGILWEKMSKEKVDEEMNYIMEELYNDVAMALFVCTVLLASLAFLCANATPKQYEETIRFALVLNICVGVAFVSLGCLR